jgi:hypothetical protein
MEVSRMKVVDEMVKALGASILTVLLIAAITATTATASNHHKIYEYTTTVAPVTKLLRVARYKS